jgi:hypothetical protein
MRQLLGRNLPRLHFLGVLERVPQLVHPGCLQRFHELRLGFGQDHMHRAGW